MTLVVALVCKDGVVIASDSLTSYGLAPLKRPTGPKLHVLGKNIVMGSAGTLGPIQEITERLEDVVHKGSEASARGIRADARNAVFEVTKDHLSRVRALNEDVHPEQVPSAEIVLVSANGGPFICHVHPDGYCEQEPQYCAIGSSLYYAELILRDRYQPDLSVEDGKLVALWTIKEASEVDTFVGGGVQIKVVLPDRVVDVPAEEIRALEDDYAFRKSVAKDLFLNWNRVSAPILKILGEVKGAPRQEDVAAVESAGKKPNA